MGSFGCKVTTVRRRLEEGEVLEPNTVRESDQGQRGVENQAYKEVHSPICVERVLKKETTEVQSRSSESVREECTPTSLGQVL